MKKIIEKSMLMYFTTLIKFQIIFHENINYQKWLRSKSWNWKIMWKKNYVSELYNFVCFGTLWSNFCDTTIFPKKTKQEIKSTSPKSDIIEKRTIIWPVVLRMNKIKIIKCQEIKIQYRIEFKD